MLRRIFIFLVLVAAAGLALYGWLSAPAARLSLSNKPYTPNPANGEVIFNAGGCSSCHAVPNQPDRTRLGGGLAIPTRFGTFYAPNISQDANDGIGRWSETDFVNAVMRGVSPGGTQLFPAFPYTSYAHATVQDVRDLFAYLKTLPAVSGRVRDHDLPFPFNIRRNIGIWKLLFFDARLLMPDQSRPPSWNRGAYLVNSFGHCAECHSPRNFLEGIVTSQRFAGGPDPEGEGWVPNMTQKGLGDWSAKDIADYLENGVTPDGDSTGGSMVRVIKNTSQLNPADRAAIGEYVKSLPPVEGPKRPPQTKPEKTGRWRRQSGNELPKLREMTVRRREFIALLASAAAIRPLGARAERAPERILYLTYSAGYRHEVIPLSKSILTQIGRNSGVFEVIATEDTSEFSTENLKRYAAVMFYTTGELPMSRAERTALLDFVRSGGGFLGVHSATDTFYTWQDYLDLIGGYFNGHPWHQAVTVEVADTGNALVAFLGNSVQFEDEIYQISDFDYRGSHVLLRLDESSVDLGKPGVHRRFYGWPLAWTRSFGQGRVFYTALGHEASVWHDTRFQRILANAILWSIRRSP